MLQGGSGTDAPPPFGTACQRWQALSKSEAVQPRRLSIGLLGAIAGFALCVPSPRAQTTALQDATNQAPNVAPARSNVGETPLPPTPATWLLSKATALQTWVNAHKGALSLCVLDLRDGRRVEFNADTPLNPASNMKVITAAVALDELGIDYVYRTALHGKADAQGAVPQLVLRGNGDPNLIDADLWRLANTLRQRGVTQVNSLLVDQTAFDEKFVPPAFEQQPNEWAAFRAPISALAVARNSVTLNVLPQAAGSDARVWFEPAGVVTLHGQVKTVGAGKGQNVQLSLVQADNGGLSGTLGGHIAAGLGRQRFTKRMEDPRLAPGLVLAQALRDSGTTVGSVRLGVVRDLPLITYITSAPLSHILAALGKQSDNFTAEMVFKSLSSSSNGTASSEASATLTTQWLTRKFSLPTGTQIRNGSGLFDSNLVAASTLVNVLRDAYVDPKRRDAFVNQLAIGGLDGTLIRRFAEPKLRGKIRAKTGTLDDTVALSGYVLRQGLEPPVVFSILVTGIKGHHGELRPLVDAVVNEIAATH